MMIRFNKDTWKSFQAEARFNEDGDRVRKDRAVETHLDRVVLKRDDARDI